MAEIRRGEMERAAQILNLSAHEWLGYRDSGMAGTPANENPASFNKADLFVATGQLVKLVRKYRPQVMVTYNSFGGYGHPDHINAHKIASAAFEYATDLERYPEPEFGLPWEPTKLYTVAFSRANWQKVWHTIKQNGEEWPFQPPKPTTPTENEGKPQPEFAPEMGTPTSELTTFIDVQDYWEVARDALLTHRTQINLDSPFTKVRAKYAELLQGTDYYILFKSRIAAQRPETDLFAGIR
jgi:LmbE family N-acetylglucosaminyl deacetylase